MGILDGLPVLNSLNSRNCRQCKMNEARYPIVPIVEPTFSQNTLQKIIENSNNGENVDGRGGGGGSRRGLFRGFSAHTLIHTTYTNTS